MATLYAIYSSDGCLGRCDANCYLARLPVCTCVCGGRNHGAGLHQAVENTRDLAEHWLQEVAAQHTGQEVKGEPGELVTQLSLW